MRITQAQIDYLKVGDKLIFFRDGGVLAAKTGSVFTFSNWWKKDDNWHPGKHFWQCQELHRQGNHEHNFSIYDTQLFDENIHKDFVLMDEEKLVHQQREFINRYGGY